MLGITIKKGIHARHPKPQRSIIILNMRLQITKRIDPPPILRLQLRLQQNPILRIQHDIPGTSGEVLFPFNESPVDIAEVAVQIDAGETVFTVAAETECF